METPTHPLGSVTEFCHSGESYHLAGRYGSYLDSLPTDAIGELCSTYALAGLEHFAPEIIYLATLYTLRATPIPANKKPAC